MSHQLLLWIIFAAVVFVMLVLDIAFFSRRGGNVRMKHALFWSAFWIGLAFAFNILVFFWQGKETALEFLTAYLVEESLSVDNLFVFLMIFSYFAVPAIHQHKVLFWGILGVVIMRGIFIFGGVALINRFHWLLYLLGTFLVFTGFKMAFRKNEKIEPEKNPVLRLFRRIMKVTDDYNGGRFFVKRDGSLFATPLFVVVLVVETTDLVFAVDSIPAVLGISVDPFVVYTSNIFAVFGLRALYFALAGFMRLFHYLHYGLSAILAFVGVKMLMSGFYKMPTSIALGVVGVILLVSVLASLVKPKEV